MAEHDLDHLDRLQNDSEQAFQDEVKKEPRPVYIGVRVVDLSQLDNVTGTVIADFYLYARWFDSAMVRRDDFEREPEEYEELWNPGLEINNGLDMDQVLGPEFAWNYKDKATGMMKYTHRFRGPMSVELDVVNFPFDSCSIPIDIGCKVYGNDKVVLVPDPDYETKPPKHRLMDWTMIRQPQYRLKDNRVSSVKTYCNVLYDMPFKRRYGFYLYKVLLINMLLSMWSWVVFWMDLDQFADRMNVALTLFLANVAFLFVISDKLPKVDFLTTLDEIILWSFLMLFASAIECFAVQLYVKRDDLKTATDIDDWSRIGFPVVYLLVLLVLVVQALHKASNV
eukprot:TRINITY_DN5632_c0_g1_i1.p1 TRINITY_DN5632_c0_g1~~TRINITY_DN5632_c0_g1_i1.p1  ORF type:complete len:338 (+),score=72.64 TRINITY_DN5632_c0_g1_i1:236-1249(+)